ncbi:hypothetical protein IFM89_012922 [Coptis chinensis]|uniref:MULE transposase domain-containing protein n=1 Tax=Coptis chinensis TaxID=261450 RepID=A0A835LID6_9MAGN|nr:hypothetical protein IFM89_012922 [Coptis chinensis]
MADANRVSRVMEDHMKVHYKSTMPRNIIDEVRQKYHVAITHRIAWHARIKCLTQIHGDYGESYNLVSVLCDQVMQSNPGSLATYTRNEDSLEFEDLCICFTASLYGFLNACRPIIGLDGCFLKGKYGGQCLSMIGLDGNNGLFPIAIFITRSETKDSWIRFLDKMKHYGINDHPQAVTFMSDRQKGLVEAVPIVFPGNEHRFCFRHMYKIFKKEFKAQHLELLVWGAAKCYTKTGFERAMEKLGTECSQAKDWFLKENVETWARSHFSHVTKCEHISNNFSESFNSWILELRDKPVVSFVDSYHILLMSFLYKRREKAKEWDSNGLVPWVVKRIAELIEYIPHYDLAESTNELQCVKDLYGNRWTVNLSNRSSYYWVSTYKQAYMGHIKPMPDPKDWPKPDPNKYVFPPPYVRGIGRPKKNRRRDEDEGLKPNKKKRKCSKCKVDGHNAKTCKGLAVEKNGRAKGKKKDRQAAPSQASATQVAAPSQASTTQVAAPSQASTNQVAAPSQASTNQVAAPSQATKLLASTSTGKKPMTRGKVAATTEASASVTQSKSVEDKELDNPKRGYIAQPTKPATVIFGKQAPKSKIFKAPHHRHTFRDFLEKQKIENNKTSKGLITAASNLTFKPPPPPKRNIQAIGGFGQSTETFKPASPPLATAVPRQKFKAVKDHGK